MRAGNSNNHKNRGQNVLYGDYHVEFTGSPFCGSPLIPNGNGLPFRDNIYTARSSMTDEQGTTGDMSYPCDCLDSYLLPTDDEGGF
jgi:hypothetical protein